MSKFTKDIGKRLQQLRNHADISIRKLAQLSGVTAGTISSIERDKHSPNIATLEKLLNCLETDLGEFFGDQKLEPEAVVVLHKDMQSATYSNSTTKILFPLREDIRVVILDETFNVPKRREQFVTDDVDMAGYIISGKIMLEVKGQPKRTLEAGDAFYIPRTVQRRGQAVDGDARVILVFLPDSR